MKYLKIFIPLLAVMLLISYFANNFESKKTEQSQTVVCSFSILQDLCSQICHGTNIKVLTIVPNSVDPHTYQPKPSDSKVLAKADLVITNGLNLEGWIQGIISSSGYPGTIIVASHGVKARHLGNLPDPHIWHDPKLICQMIENITDALKAKFSEHKEIFEKNADILKNDFQNIETQIIQIFKNILKSKRVMLTTHDAFSYFAKCYDVTVLSPQGVSTSDDPSAADMKHLINQIRTLKITAIFFENLSNPKIIKAISAETQKDVKGILFADTLKDGSNLQETLLYNAETIAKAMQNE